MTYYFEIETDIATIRWSRLSKADAIRMYKLTERDLLTDTSPIRRFRWGEET